MTRSEDSNWRAMPASSKLSKQTTPSKYQSIQEVHPTYCASPWKPAAWGVESFLYVIHLADQRTDHQSVPYVVIPPWTRLQIQISDPLDVLRWSHHLPLGIANQLHHILSCGGLPTSTILVKTAIEISAFKGTNPDRAQSFRLPFNLWTLFVYIKNDTFLKGERGFTDSKSFNHPCWIWDPDCFSSTLEPLTFWSPAMNSSGVTVPPGFR